MANTSDLVWQSSSAPTHGTIGDINTMRISPDYLGMAQDVIIDTDGILRSRGALNSITSDTFTNITHVGIVQTFGGTIVIGIDTSGNSFFYGTSAATLTGFTKLTTSRYLAGSAAESLSLAGNNNLWSSAKLPNDKGAVLCAQAPGQGVQVQGLAYLWGGGVLSNNTVAGTAASTVGTKAIVGVGTAWTTALNDSYLFINTGYVGQVDIVTSGTTLNLKRGALRTIAAAAPEFKASRTMMYMPYKGRITTNTASAVVVGSNTKFVSSSPATGGGTGFLTGVGAAVFRTSDGGYVGTVTSVQNDTTLTLTANAALALTNEEYYISLDPGSTIGSTQINQKNSFFGSSVELFTGRYWYAGINATDTTILTPTNIFGPYNLNGINSIAFSKKGEPEMLDLDYVAGDIITLPTGQNPDQIRGLCATKGGLVVFRTNDTYLITGYSPETFRAVKILDDGVQNTLCFKTYQEGVIWAGNRSVWYFDGSKIVDLLQGRVSRFYQSSRGANAAAPSGLAVSSTYILVSYRTTGANITWPYKNTTKNAQNLCMIINMLNGSISFFTNIFATTSILANPVSGTNPSPVLVTRSTATIGATTSSFLIDGSIVFQDSATAANNFDGVTGAPMFTSGAQIGPDVMWETTKLIMGDASRLKFWKRFLLNYSSDVGMTATFIGTNDTTLDFPNRGTGTASTDVVAVSSNVGILHRMRFLIRSATLSIRVYQTNTTSATSQRFKCLWWSVGGKTMRQGRVQP